MYSLTKLPTLCKGVNAQLADYRTTTSKRTQNPATVPLKNILPIMPNNIFITFFATLLGFGSIATPQTVVTDSQSQTPSSMLAEEFTRVARMATTSKPLTTNSIETALILATEATLLSPNDQSAWRVLHEVAQMADKPSVLVHAIKNLLRVVPTQPTIQLARLRDVISSSQTVDQRMSIYEQLLADNRRNQLDSGVAARLALDAAHLQRQVGDINQFARWLAEAVALDPAYPDAINLATGFFGDETADVYRRAELLASSLLSNIRDVTIQVTLAEFLMSFGDYQDAKELYEDILGDNTSSQKAINSSLLADIVLSQWASGDHESAIKTLLNRQNVIDKTFQNQTQAQQPRLNPLELARIHAPLSPKLAVVAAAIYADQEDKHQAELALGAAVNSLLSLSKMYTNQGSEGLRLTIEMYIQAAWILLWLGEDVDAATTILEQVEEGATINPNEKQRLDGWVALRKGDIETAKLKLSPLKDDPAAKIGVALIHLEEGNKRDAALQLLSVAKNNGGTLIGVWARNKLQEIVGAKFNIRPEVEQLQELMHGVLQTLHAIRNDPRPPVSIRIKPESKVYTPYQPISILVQITNNTTIPLTISSNGPIQPLILLESNIDVPGIPKQPTLPVVVSIERGFSIKPRGTLTVRVNLRNYWIGGLLNNHPLRGAAVSVTGVVNFMAREAITREGNKILVYEAGHLGDRKVAETLRVDGVRLSDTWLKKAVEDAKDVTDVNKLVSYVLLTWVVGDSVSITVEEPLITPPPGEEVVPLESGERHPLQDEAITTILSNFPKLDSTSQSWVLTTMSFDPTLEAVFGMLKEPDNTRTQLANLVRFTSSNIPDEALDDPRLLAALQSENNSVYTVATWVYAQAQKTVAKRTEALMGVR
jgi:hypothetical protein